MGNCQNQIENPSEYDTEHDPSQVLIDRSHKRIFVTKHQSNVGFLINQEKITLDNEKMHKSVALTKKSFIQKPKPKKKQIQIQPARLQILDFKFYHSLGLPQYTYPPKNPDMTASLKEDDKNVFIDEAQDRTGVIYIGERNSTGLFHGNGVLKANTVHYIGQFYHGTKHFHGREIYAHEVYQGDFKFDFRRGNGIRYTEQYVDEGYFDKFILYGKRRWKNGNIYKGTFVNNKMETIQNYQNRQESQFLDVKNNLLFKKQLLMKDNELIKAKQVYKYDTKKLLGCFYNGQIIQLTDSRYEKIMNFWDQNPVTQNRKQLPEIRYNKLAEEQKIRSIIEQWE